MLGMAVTVLALLICWGSVVWSRWSPARQDKTQKQIERAMGPCVHLFKPTLGRVLALVVDVVGVNAEVVKLGALFLRG